MCRYRGEQSSSRDDSLSEQILILRVHFAIKKNELDAPDIALSRIYFVVLWVFDYAHRLRKFNQPFRFWLSRSIGKSLAHNFAHYFHFRWFVRKAQCPWRILFCGKNSLFASGQGKQDHRYDGNC